jgi:hypothetical protein
MSEKQPMEPTYMSIREFLENGGKLPFPGRFRRLNWPIPSNHSALTALKTVETIKTSGNVDLLYEVSDIQAWAWLGLYFSDKLRAAIDYKKFLNSGANTDHQNAVRWLEKATENWKRVVQVTKPVYQPMPLMHFTHDREGEYFHWSVVEEEVIGELDWLKSINK